jgi:hypothetical protein
VKHLDRAIDIARRAGVRLRIAAKVDAADEDYFRQVIAPRLCEDGVEFIDGPEPFGLSVIEAMSCGTPVLAWPCGALPEIIDDGITGFIVNSIEEGALCVHRAAAINRRHVRRRFVERFTAARMARDYVRLYETLLSPLQNPAAQERGECVTRTHELRAHAAPGRGIYPFVRLPTNSAFSGRCSRLRRC